MGFFGKLFGKRQDKPAQAQPAAVVPAADDAQTTAAAQQAQMEEAGENRLTLQVLFPTVPTPDADAFLRGLRSLHPSMAGAKFQAVNVDGAGQGIVTWGAHEIEMLIRKRPLPSELADACIGAAHYKPEQKEAARQHRSYIVLYHQSGNVSPWDQYAALAAAAALLSRQGAVAITNAFAFTSAPASHFDQLFKAPDPWAMLQSMPPAMLYCGFVRHRIPRSEKLWMRTHGAHLLGVPDLAKLADGPQEGTQVFNVFNAVINHIRKTGQKPQAGGMLQLGPNMLLSFRAPGPREFVLESRGELLVIEPQKVGEQPAVAAV